MRFRPCIDIHNGKVKQIVGGSLKEEGLSSNVRENFVAENDASFFAGLYKGYGLDKGHIILLNKYGTPEYEADMKQAELALCEFPGGFQIGGGITSDNAEEMLDLGASHVIVTSYVFESGKIHYDRIKQLSALIGKEHLVLDLSCRRKGDMYYVVTDRWQKFTDVVLNKETICELSEYCDEFLIHAVDVEGKAHGIEENVTALIGSVSGIKSVYAGGISSYDDILRLEQTGKGKIDFTIGSALNIFGGKLDFVEIAQKFNK